MRHKFHSSQNRNFPDGFETNNAILEVVPYKPEVIFIGTYNHGWSWNTSDFYYGRDMYMWPVLGNLFLHNFNHLNSKRTAALNQPTFYQLFDICEKGKIVFADIVKGINADIEAIEFADEKFVLVNNEYIWGTTNIGNRRIGEYSDIHLNNMGANRWLDDYVNEIIQYVNDTPSIKHVYFTFKTGGEWILNKKNEICNGLRNGVTHDCIFTPTMNGFRRNLPNPFDARAWSLSHCWVWNNLNHEINISKDGYGHFDHNWLMDNGVNPDNF